MARLKPAERKKQILEAAVNVAKDYGYSRLTRELIAERAIVAPGLVNKYFNTMNNLRRAVMRYAIKNEILIIILDGLSVRDLQAMKINAELRVKVFALIQTNE